MAHLKFTPPKSVQAIKPRCNVTLVEPKGLFKTYMQQVNDIRIDTDTLDVPESNIIAQSLRFEVKPSQPGKQLFNIVW